MDKIIKPLSKRNRVEIKEIHSLNTESKLGRSKIPVKTTDNKPNAGKAVFIKCNGFNLQFSKPKQAKTAIVKSFSFGTKKCANMQTECSQPLDQGIEKNFKLDMDLNGNIPGTRNEEDFKEPSVQEIQSRTLEEYAHTPINKRKLTIDTSVHPPKYEAHSGIAFLSSPRRAVPNPFSSGEKQKQSLRSKTGVPSKSNFNSRKSIAETAGAFNLHPFVRKVQSHEIKPKTILTEKSREQVTSVHQKLDDLTTSVHKAPGVQRNYDGHSGVSFKLRQSPRTSKNPFAMDTSSEESGRQCSPS